MPELNIKENHPFTLEDVKKETQNFIQKLSQKNEKSKVAILKKNFELNGEIITIPLNNEIVESQILKSFKSEYVWFMRQTLQNQNFDIQTKAVQSAAKPETKKYAPKKDVMAELSQKYPLLKNLQKILDLRPE